MATFDPSAERGSGPTPVAAYMRMSTDMQQYSILNQTSGNEMSVDTNVITVIGAGARSQVRTFPNGGVQDTGTWASDAADDVVAHEAGHLLRLKDQYHDVPDPTNPWGVKSVPNPGYENNIISTSRMRPNEADFLHIMNDKLICH